MSKRLQIILKDEVAQELKEASVELGVSQGAYMSMLIMSKRTEREAIRLITNMSDEKLKAELDRIGAGF